VQDDDIVGGGEKQLESVAQDVSVAENGGDIVTYPPEFTVFPQIKNKKYTCAAFGVDGNPIKMKEIREGMEVVVLSEISLSVEKGYVTPSVTGVQFHVKQMDLSAKNSIAKEMYKPLAK